MAGPQHACQPPVLTVSLKPPLLSLADAERLDPETLARLASTQAEPCRAHRVGGLGLDRLVIERAEGPYCLTRNGLRILDFFAGGGALIFGHGHPRIANARRRFHQEGRHAAAATSRHAAALAHNLAAIAPGKLDTVLLAAGGGEAMETALSLAERAQRPGRAGILRAGSEEARRIPGERCQRVPFGDIAALEAAVAADPAIGVVVAETIETAGLVEAPDGFWLELRALCDRHGLLWLADEVDCAVGRTGRFFAFEHEGVAPDIVAVAKGLGAGSAVAATIARGVVHAKARRNGWAPPCGGAGLAETGEACAAAIEGLHVLYDEGLMESAARQGDRLMGRLQEIAARHAQLVRQVRGRGLMAALEMRELAASMPFGLRQTVSALQGRLHGSLQGSLAGFVSALLLRDHAVLTGVGGPGGNTIRLEPPLGIAGEHVDRLAEALDDVLSRGAMRILADILKLQAAGGSER